MTDPHWEMEAAGEDGLTNDLLVAFQVIRELRADLRMMTTRLRVANEQLLVCAKEIKRLGGAL